MSEQKDQWQGLLWDTRETDDASVFASRVESSVLVLERSLPAQLEQSETQIELAFVVVVAVDC